MTRRPALPLAALGVALAARLLLALTTDVYADEAYYWAWGQRLDWSYFDHPPMIAWLIAAFGIRGAALLCGAASTVGVFLAARETAKDSSVALVAALIWSASPAATLLGTLATPDAPLLAAWAFALWGLARGSPLVTGVAWGLAMLSKYNGVLLAVPVLVTFARRPGALAAACGLAGVLALPVVAWNASHDWAGFRFQLNHGLGGGGGLGTFGEFLLGQVGMGGLLLVPLGLWWAVRGALEQRALRSAVVVPLVFFGLAAWRARGEANWAAAAWMAAAVGLAPVLSARLRWATALAGLVPAALLALVLAFPPEALQPSAPVRRLHGAAALSALRPQAAPAFSSSYQLSSQVALLAGLPAGTVGGRRSQYDLWPSPAIAPGGAALWVSDPSPPAWEVEPPPAELAARFERVVPVPFPAEGRQARLHRYAAFRLEGYRPTPAPVGP